MLSENETLQDQNTELKRALEDLMEKAQFQKEAVQKQNFAQSDHLIELLQSYDYQSKVLISNLEQ